MADGTLLREMLQVLADGGIHATAEVARRIGVSERLVAAMVEDLSRHGFLTPLESRCDQRSCSGCWAAGNCNRSEPTPMLALTPKGRQAVHRPR